LDTTPTPASGLNVNLQQLLKAMVEQGASDLHITTGSPPQLRIDGVLVPLRVNQLSQVDTKQLCYSVLTDTQKLRFEEDKELDFSFGVRGVARFRANLFMQRGAVGGAFRTVPFQVKNFADLGLPPVIEELCNKPRGMVLVTGPTGSGKTTSLAAMIDKINSERHEHIITIEDPIEYLHAHKKCLINQREIGADTDSFKKALKYILRQDPDVVLIGKCATSKPSKRRWSRRKPATCALRPCTPIRPCKPSIASSTSFPPPSSRKSAPSFLSCWKGSSARRCCRAPRVRGASRRWK
jgi:pilus retraction protein PilT